MKFFKDKKYEVIRQFLLWWAISFVVFSTQSSLAYKGFDPDPHYAARVFMFDIIYTTIATLSAMAHYYWFYKEYFVRKKYFSYAISLILFTAFLLCLTTFLLYNPKLNYKQSYWSKNIFQALFLASITTIMEFTSPALIYTFARANINSQKHRNLLEKEILKNSLLLLKNQLEPHFLFNTLNTVYASAQAEHADKTAACIEELSGLFRYSINEANKEIVPVQEELAFIEKYLHLQRLRLEGNTSIEIETKIVWDNIACQIAPMLLLPFIENAFKYGISLLEGSKVYISISIENTKLAFDCRNTDHANKLQHESTGMGVANTIKRLELQYGNHYQLQQENNNGIYSVHLSIDLS